MRINRWLLVMVIVLKGRTIGFALSDEETKDWLTTPVQSANTLLLYTNSISDVIAHHHPLDGSLNIVIPETFGHLLKPLLSRTVVTDKGIVKLGSGFSVDVDDDEAIASGNYTHIIGENSNTAVSAGLNFGINPDNSIIELFKGGQSSVTFGGNVRFTGLWKKTNLSYTNEQSAYDLIKIKEYSAILKQLREERELLNNYVHLYQNLSNQRTAIVEYIDNYVIPFNNSTQVPLGAFIAGGPNEVTNFYNQFGYGTSPIVEQCFKIVKAIDDTLTSMVNVAKDLIPDNGPYAEFVAKKIVEYEVGHLDEMITSYNTFFWDASTSIEGKRYPTIDISSLSKGYDSVEDEISSEIFKPIFSIDVSPINILHFSENLLEYLNFNVKYKLTNSYSTLGDDDKVTIHAVKEHLNADSTLVNEVQEFKGFDIHKDSMAYLHVLEIKLYNMMFFKEKKIFGIEGTMNTSIRPGINSIFKVERRIVKLDFSVGALFSIPSKTDDDASVVNLALLLNVNDILNSDAKYKHDDTALERFKNRFGIGIRIGIPINKILLNK